MDALKKGKYRVTYERDESGTWIARVPSVRGCHTYGQTLEQARRRVREALKLWVADADTVVLVDDIHLPGDVKKAVRESRRARAEAESERQRAHEVTVETAHTLVGELRLGLRDAGELLGLSRQRVQQLLRR